MLNMCQILSSKRLIKDKFINVNNKFKCMLYIIKRGCSYTGFSISRIERVKAEHEEKTSELFKKEEEISKLKTE